MFVYIQDVNFKKEWLSKSAFHGVLQTTSFLFIVSGFLNSLKYRFGIGYLIYASLIHIVLLEIYT